MKTTNVRFEPGANIPAKAGTDLDAGTLVIVTAGGITPTVAAATAGSIPLGIVAHEVKQGDLVTVLRGTVVAEAKATGAIAAGANVAAGANGVAVTAPADTAVIGIATQAAANNLVYVAFK
ncbi:capsid cement protein [Corynebacterium callunae]|uniref:capsid cement protein n=1 Tax=Corynebacterium callunae TaxID=1721 RepID=UPI003982113C